MTSLEGIRVLDLTRMHAGPFASMILGDLGADVLKIEPPGGDSSRVLTEYMYGGIQSAFFVASNRNKRSIVLDINSDEGRLQFETLLDRADILIDNFRPSTLRRLGLHYETVSKRNPSIICVSVNGYGEGTPNEDLPAYDLLVQAQSGVMALTGEPEGPPLKVGVPIGDLLAGVYATVGALAALCEREVTGLGQRVEVSMLDAQMAMLHYHFNYYDVAGESLPRVGSGHHNIVPYGLYACKDGEIAVAVAPDPPKFWQSFCEAVGRNDWLEDERYSTQEARATNRDQLRLEVEEILGVDDRETWLVRMKNAGVPVAPVNGLSDLETDPQISARGMVVEIPADYGTIRVMGNPIRMQGALPKESWKPPPLLEDGVEVGDVLEDWGRLPQGGPKSVSSMHLDFSDEGVPRLRGWRCSSCQKIAFGTRKLCPVCAHSGGEETVLGPHGNLETWSRVGSLEDGYLIGYALIGDGRDEQTVRVFGPIGVPASEEAALGIGIPIAIEFKSSRIGDEERLHHSFVLLEQD
jgi:crotonobetainyl-CoA:carnitine CoA-transferase CaiB-like acyl-CoA transferase/uncharacterized OB-fold protein